MLADRLAGLFFIGLGGYSIMEAVRLYPKQITPFSGDHLLPAFVGGALVFCGGLLILGKSRPFRVKFPERGMLTRMLLILILLAAFWISLPGLGYTVATFILAAGLFRLFGSYRLVRSLLYSAILTAVLQIVFIRALHLPFPAGLF